MAWMALRISAFAAGLVQVIFFMASLLETARGSIKREVQKSVPV